MKYSRLLIEATYRISLFFAYPIALLRVVMIGTPPKPRSVLHVSSMVHVPWYMTRILREHGWQADYMAVGDSPHWSLCDYKKRRTNPLVAPFYEVYLFWVVLARYEVIHLHFMITMSRSGWELPLLKKMGRRIVVHYRGCEARDRAVNMRMHPEMNICQDCDYNSEICTSKLNRRRRALGSQWADATLVTTPDMRDFLPDAIVSSFFAPDDVSISEQVPWDGRRPLRLVHVTNHPGIEGTARIRRAVEAVRAKGHEIEFLYLRNLPHADVMAAMRGADMAIGKMKMGYFANAQIESMICGVPTITWIRPEFMTEALRESGFIICHLDDLEQTLLFYISNPAALGQKQKLAAQSIRALHDNTAIAETLIACYSGVGQRKVHEDNKALGNREFI